MAGLPIRPASRLSFAHSDVYRGAKWEHPLIFNPWTGLRIILIIQPATNIQALNGLVPYMRIRIISACLFIRLNSEFEGFNFTRNPGRDFISVEISMFGGSTTPAGLNMQINPIYSTRINRLSKMIGG